MTSIKNPYTNEYYNSLARHTFNELAPSVQPTERDLDMLMRLAAEMQNVHNPMTGPLHYRLTQDEGLWLAQINDPFGRPLISCWIEFASTPNAYFYWES